MKRFYKFLMPLVAIVALALPARVAAQATCDNGTITVSNADTSTTTTSYFPAYAYYNYSVSEQIVPADALEGLGEIHSMQFKPSTATAGSYYNNCEVYLSNTTAENLADGWITTDLHLVFTGSLNYTTTDWQTITFDTAFNYTGGNLVVLVRRGHGDYLSGCGFQAYNAGPSMGRYAYRDGSAIPIANIPDGASNSTTSTVGWYKFSGCYSPVTCARVASVSVSDIIPDGATISWVDTLNSGASYTIVNMANDSILASSITDTFYVISGLDNYTSYSIGVYADCGSGISGIRGVSFTTLRSCPAPTELAIDSVSTDEITLSWTPGYQENSWLLSINDSVIEVYGSPYTISDLTPNTVYNLKLRSICSDDTSLFSQIVTRTLPGEPVSEFPYTCDFEDADENAGWVLENGSQPNAWYIGTAVNNGGANALYVSNNNGTTHAYTNTSSSHVYAYRYINFSDTGSYAFSFDWHCQGESNYYDYLRAWLSPASVNHEAGDGSTYNYSTLALPGCIDLVGANSNGQYTLAQTTNFTTLAGEFRISTPGTYKLVFLWSNDGSGGSNPPAAVDNVFINTNSCPAPYNLVATYVGSDTIELSWSAGGEETSWLVSVNGGAPMSVSSNTLTLDGLNANTAYNINVQAECGGDDVSIPASLSVRTACGVINLPFAEDFTGMASSSYPDCWTRVMSGSYPYITTSYGNSIQFAGTAAVIAPHINAPLNQMIVSFDLRKEGSSSGSMTFGYTSDPVAASDMVVLHTIDPSTTATYFTYEYDLSLDSAVANLDPDSVYYLVWRQSSTSTIWYYWLDNVNIEQYNPCTKPQNFTCTSTQPDSVVVTWNAGDASSWELYVGPAGVPVNEDSAFAVNDSVYVFTNLQGGVAYNFYVRTDCGGDYSNWAGPLAVTPGQYIIGTSGSASITMCGGVIYDDGGATGQYSNSADFTLTVSPSHPDSMLTFQGWAYTEGSIDYLRIYEGTSPTGTILWETSTSSQLDNIPYTIVTSGPITLKWHTDGSVVYDGFELQIGCMAAPECSPVDNLTAYPTPTAALVTWQPGYYGNYTGATVEYKADTADAWISLPAVTGNYAVISGLDPLTMYNVRVTTDCDGFPGGVAMATFSSTDFPCEVFDTAGFGMPYQIGNGTGTSYYLPIGNFYNYSYTQQLYLASEFDGAMSINGIDFQYAYGSSNTAKTNVTIYMANVSATSLSNGFVPYDASTFVPVYTGSLACTSGWNHFDFTTPFNYDGSSNLLLVVHDNSGDYDGSSYVFSTTPCASGLGRYVQNDGSAYSINTVSGGTSLAYRANVKFSTFSCLQSSTCAAPAATVVDVTTTTATVVWAPGSGESSWNVYYRLAGDASWSAPTAVTVNSHTFTGLLSGRKYEFKVENACSEGNFSATTQGTTLCAQISSLPFTENFNGWGTGTVPNCWSNAGSYSPNSYGVISGSYNHSGSTGGSLYMYSSSTLSNKTYVSLPELDTLTYHANQLQLVFSLFYTITSYGRPAIEVGVMSDPNNPASFVVVDTVQHSGALSTWEVFEVPMSGYTGNGSYVAMRTAFDSAYSYFYLDDLTLEVIPTCPRPDSLTATNATTNSVDLSWHERGGASQWIIEYGPRGFQLGTGTTVTATSNPFTLTGLPASFQGEYYVKSICGAGDTGEYSRMSYGFGTTQVPATLPYNYDFESAAEWANWQTSSNSETASWYRGTDVADSSSYSMYVANSDSGYFDYSFSAVVNAAVYRDIDFGPIDSSYTLSFRARVGGTTTASYDGLMVFLVDPSIATTASSSNITSPWGNVNDLYRIATVRLDTNWTTYEASFDTISGIQRVAFFWFNQNTGASYTNIPQPAAVDNIHIDYSSCPRPVNLEAVSTSSSTATLTWDGEAGADYEVTYRQVGGANMTTIAHTNSVTLTGLASTSEYRAWVRKICGAGDTSLYCDGTAFNTTMCDGAVIAATGDPSTATGTTYYAPVNNFYNYTLSETIIDSAELGGAMNITSLAYYYDYSDAMTDKNNVTIWIQPTTKSAFSSSSDIVALDTTTAVQVYSGNLNCSEGWNYFAFTTDYSYSGTGNLLVIVDDNSGEYNSSSYVFASQSTSAYKTIVYYSDSNNPDINNLSSSYSGNKGYYQYRPVMQLISCGGTVECIDPVILSDTTGETTATFTWGSTGASSYEVAVVEGTWVAPASGTVVADTTYTFTGLTAETVYTLGVRSVCAGSNVSEWATVQVVTAAHPCAVPTNVTTSDITFSGATIGWTLGEEEAEWDLHVTGTNYDETVTVQTNPYTLTGLNAAQEYTVTVRARCNETNFSEWSAPATFSTQTCQPVNGVSVGNLTANSATVSWTAPAGVSNFEVEYGTSGFARGNGTTVTVSGTSYTINGLTADMAYDVYVRSVCAEGVSSAWSDAVEFTTLENQGIDDVANAAISLYPNPASSTVTIDGISGEATVTVVDMNGRVVITTQALSSSVTLSLSDLAQGAYFVRITGEQVNAIRKLIVK